MSDYAVGFTYLVGDRLVTSNHVHPPSAYFKTFLNGNGTEPFTITEMLYQQGTKTVYVTCSGHRSFQVPAMGRYSDYIDLSSFQLIQEGGEIPETIYLNYTISGYVPVDTGGNPIVHTGTETEEESSYDEPYPPGYDPDPPVAPPAATPVDPTGASQLIVLNFEDGQGSTTFLEEAQGLIPLLAIGYSVDETWSQFGSGSLSADYGYLLYFSDTPAGNEFTFHCFLKREEDSLAHGMISVDGYVPDKTPDSGISVIYDENGNTVVLMEQFTYLSRYATADRKEFEVEQNIIGDESIHLAIVVKGTSVKVYFDGQLHVSHTMEVPFVEINAITFINDGGKFNVDAVEFTATEKWSADFEVPTTPPSGSNIAVSNTAVQGELLFDAEFEGTFKDSVKGLLPISNNGVSLTTDWSQFGSGSAAFAYSGSGTLSYNFTGEDGSTDIKDTTYDSLVPTIYLGAPGATCSIKSNKLCIDTSNCSGSGQMSLTQKRLDMPCPLEITYTFSVTGWSGNGCSIGVQGVRSDGTSTNILDCTVRRSWQQVDTHTGYRSYDAGETTIITDSGFVFTPGENVQVTDNTLGDEFAVARYMIGTVVSCVGNTLVVNLTSGYLGFVASGVDIAHMRYNGITLSAAGCVDSIPSMMKNDYGYLLTDGVDYNFKLVLTGTSHRLYINGTLIYTLDIDYPAYKDAIVTSLRIQAPANPEDTAVYYFDNLSMVSSNTDPYVPTDLVYPKISLAQYNTFSLSYWYHYRSYTFHILHSYDGNDVYTFMQGNFYGSEPMDIADARESFGNFDIALYKDILIDDKETTYIDSIQLIGKYFETSDFTPPNSPYETEKTPGRQLLETTVATNAGTITVDSSLIEDGCVIIIDDVIYTFVESFTGADNELLIGLDSESTALYMVDVFNDTAGALLTATAGGNVVAIEYLSEKKIGWSTTCSGIELSELTLEVEYKILKANTLPAFKSTGYSCDSGFGGVFPALTSSGMCTQEEFVLSYRNKLPAFKSTGKSYLDDISGQSTAEKQMAHLLCNNGWMANYASKVAIFEGDKDDTVLVLTTYVATHITYTVDPDGGDTWKDPQKTLVDGYGDCEDGAFLLFSLIVNSGIPPSQVRVYMGTLNGEGHAWVAYLRQSDSKWVILDWTVGIYWIYINSLNQLPKAYEEDYFLYTGTSYISCSEYVTLSNVQKYINSIFGAYTENLNYPAYEVTGKTDHHSGTYRGEYGFDYFTYPKYSINGYFGATTYSDKSYQKLDYPKYLIKGTGYGNVIGIHVALNYPKYGVTGKVISGNLFYTESNNLAYPKYAISSTAYVVASMNGALTYPRYVINSHISAILAADADAATYDGTEPNTSIRMNTSNFAVTRYSGFHFNSMCNYMNEIIMANSNGIFRHTGNADLGANIDAYFQLPSTDFGLFKQKSYRKVYVEGYSEGELEVTTVVGDSYKSKLRIDSFGRLSETQYVFERQRDDRGNLIGLRISNNNGKYFMINSIYATLILSSHLPTGYTGLGRSKFDYANYEVSASAS